VASKERPTDLAFEQAHLGTDGRLRQMELASRCGHLPRFGDDTERLESPRVDVEWSRTAHHIIIADVSFKSITFPGPIPWLPFRARKIFTRSPSPTPLATPLLAAGALLAIAPFTPAAAALLGGAGIALVAGNSHPALTRAWTHRFLPFAVVGLRAGMNLRTVARAGLHGLGYTAVSLALVLVTGLLLTRLLRVERPTALLISVGTAICGGSAIAAVAPVIRAREHQMSVALATVFLLNSAALLVFTAVGHAAGLEQGPFGLWAALAIHDTSSVVGAGMAYGTHALEVATTVKLARALWIVPVTFALGMFVARDRSASDAGPVKKPWFIAGFLAAAALVTYVPGLQRPGQAVAMVANRALVLTLFLIGAGLSRDSIRTVGARPFVQGLLLWILVSAAALGAVHSGLLTIG
jgi:uncharacterized integral membrane protein (TIGR00698 family)